MSSKKPIIGVTGPDDGGTAAWWFTKLALFMQGAKAVRIQPKTGRPAEDIHGLIIGGGADINPERYGETGMKELLASAKNEAERGNWLRKIATILFFPFIFIIRKAFSTKHARVDDQRDKLELDLLARAIDRNLPVLGICRGAQLINIYLGGTLHNDIGSFYTEVPMVYTVWPEKRVEIEGNSKLCGILKVDHTFVNALHYQAVNDLGEGLSVVARERSGVVQAIEHRNYPFLIGVQWHPEYMPQIRAQRRLFKEMVRQSSCRKSPLKKGE